MYVTPFLMASEVLDALSFSWCLLSIILFFSAGFFPFSHFPVGKSVHTSTQVAAVSGWILTW